MPITVNVDDGPCGWIIDPLATGCCPAWDDYEPEQQTAAAVLAATWMWAATARQYGQCETTVHVCRDRHGAPTWAAYPVVPGDTGGGWGPYLLGGTWFNGPAGADACCSTRCELRLPGPVASTADIIEVIDGSGTVDPAAYQLFDGVKLVRVDGQCWPSCCNAATADTAIIVTYMRGKPVPFDVRLAAGILACEFALACTGGECRLPRRVSAMTQMGTTVDFADLPGPGVPVMALGITEIDEVVKARNPYGLATPPRLINPNQPRPRFPM